MSGYSHVELAAFRREKAQECLSDARDALTRGRYANAANRAYYAVFNAMRAVLNLHDRDFRRHSGIISEFRRTCVKTGIFPVQFSLIIQDAFQIRNACDYEPFYVPDPAIVAEVTANAEIFVNTVERYLSEHADFL